MWDDWDAIAAAQAKADQEEAARQEARQRRTEGPQLPVSTDEPIAAPGPPEAAVDESQPVLRFVDQWRSPEPEPRTLDVALAFRLLAKKLRGMLPTEEEDHNP